MTDPATGSPEALRFADAEGWRAWLVEHADTASVAWVVLPHQDSPGPGPNYEDAVRQGLCFGWIDSTRRKHDEHSSVLRFSPRRPRSPWSASNRERVAQLLAEGLMTPRGQAEIDQAKARGTWDTTAP